MIYLKKFQNDNEANDSFQPIPFIGTLNDSIAYASEPSEDDGKVRLQVDNGDLNAVYKLKISSSTVYGDRMKFSINDGEEYFLLNDSMEFLIPKGTVIDLKYSSEHPVIEHDGWSEMFTYVTNDGSIPVVEHGQTTLSRLFRMHRNTELTFVGATHSAIIGGKPGGTDHFD